MPIENSIEGSVNLTLDALAFGQPGVFIRGEIAIPISMCLLAMPGTALRDIVLVRSMPHALAQNRGWLSENLPLVRLEPYTSTAEAARLAAEKPLAGAEGEPLVRVNGEGYHGEVRS